jgi:hypothetical protein
MDYTVSIIAHIQQGTDDQKKAGIHPRKEEMPDERL